MISSPTLATLLAQSGYRPLGWSDADEEDTFLLLNLHPPRRIVALRCFVLTTPPGSPGHAAGRARRPERETTTRA